jgi:hypothetical protein
MSDAKLSLEDQIARLAELGVRLAPGVRVEDLLRSWSREDLEAEPFQNVLIALGGEIERAPYPPASPDVWHLDTECVEDDGAYVAVAERVQLLARDRVTFTNIRDRVNLDAEKVWLAFSAGGDKYRWDLEVQDDWIDTNVFTLFEEVLAKHADGLRFIYLDLGGQDCLLLLGDENRHERLRAATGLDFTWMSA